MGKILVTKDVNSWYKGNIACFYHPECVGILYTIYVPV